MTGFADAVQRVLHFLERESPIPRPGESSGSVGARPGETRWLRVGALPTPRNYARAVVFRSAIYVVGGSTTFGDSHGATGSTVVERYRPKPRS